MRQLVTLPSAEQAQRLADYLLTQRINTQVEQQPEGCIVWVCDEDQVAPARRELEAFTSNPEDPRYLAAAREAGALRREKQQTERAYHRRQERFAARMGAFSGAGRWTVGLIIVCILVSMLTGGGETRSSLLQALSISPYRYVLVLTAPSGTGEDYEDEVVKVELRSPGIEPILHGQVWRVVTPMLLHFSIWHLVFNMSWLYALGGAIERRRGAIRYVAFVLVVAAVSNLAQYYFGHVHWDGAVPRPDPQPNFGGMSGVVYGLFGYVWMKARFQPELGLGIHPNNVIIMMVWFFLCMTPWMTSIIGSGVANVAHAAGLIAGIAIGYVPIWWQSFRSP